MCIQRTSVSRKSAASLKFCLRIKVTSSFFCQLLGLSVTFKLYFSSSSSISGGIFTGFFGGMISVSYSPGFSRRTVDGLSKLDREEEGIFGSEAGLFCFSRVRRTYSWISGLKSSFFWIRNVRCCMNAWSQWIPAQTTELQRACPFLSTLSRPYSLRTYQYPHRLSRCFLLYVVGWLAVDGEGIPTQKIPLYMRAKLLLHVVQLMPLPGFQMI